MGCVLPPFASLFTCQPGLYHSTRAPPNFQHQSLVSPHLSANLLCAQAPTQQSRSTKWQDIHAHIRRQEALPDISWSQSHSMRGVPLVPRVLDLIELTYQRYHQRTLQTCPYAEVGPDGLLQCRLLLDVSQCASRRAFSHHVRSFCSGKAIYSFEKDRLLTADEHMLCLGWPSEKVPAKQFSQATLKELSGESMACPCIAVALATICMLIPDTWVHS